MKRPEGRLNFPDCPDCPYINPGHWAICTPCASEQLASIADPCPICAQERAGGECRNWLCTGNAGPLHIAGIQAITLHRDPLDRVLARYKYEDKHGWAIIFARLLVGHLSTTWDPDEVDLIVANPPNPDRQHTTRVITYAALTDTASDWPFDDTTDPAIIKTAPTDRSAGKKFDGKQAAAQQHAGALQLRHPARIDRQRIIVYDDVCTTGLQLNEVARRLREWGAISVHGVVLGRQPWG